MANIYQQTDYNPNYAVHPGEILSDILESKGISQVELCKRMGRPEKTISEIISGKSSITPETALQLEQALNVPATFWNNLDKTYQEITARIKNKEKLQDELKFLKNYPYKELIKRSWIEVQNSTIDQTEEVLKYFGVTSFTHIPQVMPVAFRKHKGKAIHAESVATWLRKGEIDAEKIITLDFDEIKLKENLIFIKSLSKFPPKEFLPKLDELLRSCGVVLVFTKYFSNTQICGASRWITSKKALIQLSLKGGYADSMWFTLFHELAHILLHSKKEEFIDLDPKENINSSKIEDEANKWASEQLISPKFIQIFQTVGNLNKESLLKYANMLGIDIGILVGRLQNMEILKSSELTELKKKYTFEDFQLIDD